MSIKSPKVPPYSNEAERSVLGCMLLDKDSVIVALNALTSEDFYVEQNKLVFQAIKTLNANGYAIDAVTVWDKISSEGLGEKIGAGYITSLAEIVPFTQHIEQYCKIVTEKATLREMIIGFSNIVSECYEDKESAADLIEKAERFVYNLSMNKSRNDFVSLSEAVTPAILKLGELYEQNNSMTGVPTGFAELDRITNGLQPSDLILIAARPSMGKTSLGLNIAQNAAIRNKKTVAFFSLEMSCEQLIMRIISSESDVDSAKIKSGSQSIAEWKRITIFNSSVKESDIEMYIDDTSGISVGEIRSKLRKLKSTKGLDIVVIDYLQLMSTNLKTENRQQEISAISRDLKALAKELKCPVVSLSQLSRNPESRKDRRPILSDLRESGAIEQDADVVMMLYRESYYERELNSDETELIIAKHRNGETGTIKLRFLSEFTRFEDMPPRSEFQHEVI